MFQMNILIQRNLWF